MELMIVIVIIGILSAVGIVMFGGQAEKAKINSTKAIHKQVVTYITVEMMNCSMGDTTTMGGSLTCSGRTPTSVVAAAVTSQSGEHENPYQVEKAAVTSGGANTASGDAGFIRLSVSGQKYNSKNLVTHNLVVLQTNEKKKLLRFSKKAKV